MRSSPDESLKNVTDQEAKESRSIDDYPLAPREIDPSILAHRNFKEAPMLAAHVEAGELPPVSQRLPDNPHVITPVERIGSYGGTITRRLASDINDETAVRKTLSESLMEYERPVPGKPQLNLAESYEFLDQGRTAIFRLRKGLRWSDGVPFTVDDILFWYEDMTLDENALYDPLFPTRWTSGGKPVRMSKVDDYTLKISADESLGKILRTLCHDHIALPKHVFAQYHPKYNPEASYSDLKKRTTYGQLAFEPGIPRLSAWVPVKWEHGQKALYERNPYYWKVDTEGNQLPYADHLEFVILSNSEIALLKFMNGEIDLFDYSVSDNFSMLKGKENEGQIKVQLTATRPLIALFLNWDAPNPALRQAFRRQEVRIALSHALNRREISDILENGLLEPIGFSLSRASPWYSEQAAKTHSQYDPDKSRALLEEAGYKDTDADGYREFPDGSPFTIIIDVFNHPTMIDLCQFVAEYWEAVGIKSILNIGLQEILIPRRINGKFEVHVTSAPIDPLFQAERFAAMGPNLPFWHRNAGQTGPKWLHEVTSAIRKAESTLDDNILDESMIFVRDTYTRELPFIMIGAGPMVWASNNRVGNIPQPIYGETSSRGWDRGAFHEQLFFIAN